MKLQAGDRIAYSQRFLRDVLADHAMASRRGTLVALAHPSMGPGFCVVCWDDQAASIAAKRGYFAQTDYVEDVLKNGGTAANLANLAKVNSAAFAGR